MSKMPKDNINVKELGLLLLVLILTIISLIFFVKEIFTDKKNNVNTNINSSTNSTTGGNNNSSGKNQAVVPKNDDEIVKMLSSSNYKERDRIEYYCGEYFKHLDKKQYDSAYNMLYDEFKQRYFPTVEQYEEYVKKTYPDEWALDYSDITRQGNIYVLKLKIIDVLGTTESEKYQRVVIRENNYNDFDISFQVI